MKLLSLILIISLFSSNSFGLTTTTNDGTICDWSKVTSNADGTYIYSKELNLCVGKTVQDNETRKVQVADLFKAIDLYKQTIQTDEQRIQNAIDALSRISARVEQAEGLQSKNNTLHFALGIVVTGLAVWGAGQLK